MKMKNALAFAILLLGAVGTVACNKKGDKEEENPSNVPGDVPGDEPGNVPGDGPGDVEENTPIDLRREVSADAVEISTVEQFLAFRQVKDEAAKKDYKLVADIDLTGVTLPSSTDTKFEGVFDGNGHKIKNGAYTSAGSKSGLLVGQLLNGGVVKNVKFVGCRVESTNESAAIVAGEANGSGAVINCEFSTCVVNTTGNYGALVIARSEGDVSKGKEILIDGITIKNYSSVSCNQYGGVVVGDSVSNITILNSQITATFNRSAGNWGLLCGRSRNTDQVYTVKNSIVDITVDKSVTDNGKTGVIFDGSNCKSATVENVMILSNTKAKLCGEKASSKMTLTNVKYDNEETMNAWAKDKENSVVAKVGLQADPDATFYSTFLDNFSELWVVEANGGIRLKNASANVVGDNDRLVNISVITASANVRFEKGTSFTPGNLVVNGEYDSDITVSLTADKYEIDSSSFDMNTAGTYQITVKSKADATISTTYDVSVVEETGIEIDTQFVTKTYIKGETLSTNNIFVKVVWSDGKKTDLSSDKYTVNTTDVDMNTAGTYDVIVSYGSYTPVVYQITVIDNAAVSDSQKQVVVNVDAAFDGADGTLLNYVATFKTLQSALDYLQASKLAGDVEKIINVSNGEYREKVTISMPNVTLIGESMEGTKIVYDAVESTFDPVSNKAYGMNCATLTITGSNFTAKNIGIINDFNYAFNQNDPSQKDVKEGSPQGIALRGDADKSIFENCWFYGNQDTIYLRSGRSYFKGGKIEGNIDFICGTAGIAYFDDVTINAIDKGYDYVNEHSYKSESNNGYVAVWQTNKADKPNYGVIFNNCHLTADATVKDGSMALGRTWGDSPTVAYINCDMSSAYSKLAFGSGKSRWDQMSGLSPVNADLCEYGSTGAGAITEAVTGGKVLTAEQAANYTMENLFAAANGKVTFATAWDPTSVEPEPEDPNTYYFFNAQQGTTSKSFTYDQDTNAVEGKIINDWNGLTIDGTAGKVTARASDTQVNAGGKISFTVAANSSVTVTTHTNAHEFTLNGVGTTASSFTQFYQTETEVTFEAIVTTYLYTITIMPNQTAPAEAVVESLTVTGAPSNDIAIGEELDLSGLVVKANYSDNSYKTLNQEEYSIDTTLVDKNTAGTYTVKVTFNGVEQPFTVNYVNSVSTSIGTNTTWSFKDDKGNAGDGYYVFDDSTLSFNKLTIAGSAVDNDDWLRFNTGATASFEVEKACTVTVMYWNSAENSTVTLAGGSAIEGTASSVEYSKDYQISGPGVVTITATSNGYIGKIIVTFEE